MIRRRCVGVIGSGVMGVGVAVTFGRAGFEVVLIDSDPEALAAAPAAARKVAQMAAMVRGDERDSWARAPTSLRCEATVEALADVDVVIENVTENHETKAAVYTELANIVDPNTLIGANTSGVSITWLASHLSHPERVIGTHFMNPVPLKDGVELIRGVHTSDETVERTEHLLAEIGKSGTVVRDGPGFVINRVLMLAINEAARAVEDGTATAAQVDTLFRDCLGHPMGPLETADLIGLDTVRDSLDVLFASQHDTKYAAAAILRRLVDSGQLGRKVGRGFHEYIVKGARR